MDTGGLPLTVNLMFFMWTFIDMSTPFKSHDESSSFQNIPAQAQQKTNTMSKA